MLKKIMMAGIAVGALALNAPIASASHITADCGMDTVQQADVTGQTYEGAVYGVAVNSEGGSANVKCVVYVNGNPVAQTPEGSGTPVATSQGQVSYNADDDDVVVVCAHYNDGHGNANATSCGTADHQQIPPQVVYDTIDGVLNQVWPIIDPPICQVIKTVLPAPGIGPVVTNNEGDIWLQLPDGSLSPQWDCPPYLMDWDGDGQPG